MQKKTLRKFAIFASILALCVILLGAWTRLSDAGLGCPDWPGCYGHFTVPQDADYIKQAEVKYNQVFEADKAWPEMIHRHFAKAIGLVIIILFIGAWRGLAKTLVFRFCSLQFFYHWLFSRDYWECGQ